MPDLDRRPAHRLTQAQAADLLGVSVARVAELVGEGRLTPVAKWAKAGLLRADVERRTLARWRPGDTTWMATAWADTRGQQRTGDPLMSAWWPRWCLRRPGSMPPC